jgi:hypothetical protein
MGPADYRNPEAWHRALRWAAVADKGASGPETRAKCESDEWGEKQKG